MELDDLKRRWADHDRKLDHIVRLNTRRLRAITMGQAETAMRRLARLLWVEVLVNLAAAAWLGSFIAQHVAEARFLIPAVTLDLGAILLLVVGVNQLVSMRALDYGAPIVAIQKRLESLRVQRIRATQLTLVASPLLWTPLLMVAMKGLAGVDAYATLDVAWLIVNLLFGVLVLVSAIWASRRYADRMERSPRVQRLMQDLAGHSLNAATTFLASLAELEQDESHA